MIAWSIFLKIFLDSRQQLAQNAYIYIYGLITIDDIASVFLVLQYFNKSKYLFMCIKNDVKAFNLKTFAVILKFYATIGKIIITVDK